MLDIVEPIKVLIPTSGPVPAMKNAEYSLRIAKSLNAKVTVVHIRDHGEDREGDIAFDIFLREADKQGMHIDTKPAQGPLVETLIGMVRLDKPDLVIMGATRGRIVANWIVDKLVKETDSPVVLIPWQEDTNVYIPVVSAPGG